MATAKLNNIPFYEKKGMADSKKSSKNAYHQSKVAVIGIGGAGVSVVSQIITTGARADFLTLDTDRQKLGSSLAKKRFLLGGELYKGLGTAIDPKKGERAALEDREQLQEMIKQYEMIYMIAGMGGGTGSGASIVLAKIARKLNIRTIAILLKPLSLEGSRRRRIASESIDVLLRETDICIDFCLIFAVLK